MMEKHRTKTRTRRWPWLAAFLLLAAASTAVLSSQRDDTPDDTEVTTVRVQRGPLRNTITATGVVRPVVGAEINVGSRISGRVVHLPVRVGDTVRAGDLLAELDATELDARIREAQADLEVARAELAQARAAFDRRRRLAADGVLPPADLDLAQRDLDVAEARVERGGARLEAAEANRGYARITAPIPGVIAAVTTREGETVAASFAAPNFVTILDLERLEIRAYVDETDIGRVDVGQRATFTVDTYPDTDVEAVVTAIEPKAEIQDSVVNYVVVLSFDADAREDGAELRIRPEMTAHLRLTVDEREAVVLPRNTLRRLNGRRAVRVLRGGDWVDQEVDIGWRTDESVEVLGGVREGDVVQVNPK